MKKHIAMRIWDTPFVSTDEFRGWVDDELRRIKEKITIGELTIDKVAEWRVKMGEKFKNTTPLQEVLVEACVFMKILTEVEELRHTMVFNPKEFKEAIINDLFMHEIEKRVQSFPNSIILLLQFYKDYESSFAHLISFRNPIYGGRNCLSFNDAHPTFNLIVNLFDLAKQIGRADTHHYIEKIKLSLLNEEDLPSEKLKALVCPKLLPILTQASERLKNGYESHKSNDKEIIQEILNFIYQDIKIFFSF